MENQASANAYLYSQGPLDNTNAQFPYINYLKKKERFALFIYFN